LIPFTAAQALAACFCLSPGAALPLAAGLAEPPGLALAEGWAFIIAARAAWLFEDACADAAGVPAGFKGGGVPGLSPAVAVAPNDAPALNAAATIA
jgi:hypothetical protein